MNKGATISLIFIWVAIGSIWAMDVAIASVKSVQLAKGIIIDGVLFYHIFMYLLVLSCLLYPLYMLSSYSKQIK